MKRMLLAAASAASVVLLLAGCTTSSVSIAQLDTIPSSIDVGGAAGAGGEPAVGWGDGEATFYVASPATGICIGVPTAIRAESTHAIHVVFTSSDSSTCPGKTPVTWQLTTPPTIDTSDPVSVIITAPNDGSLADGGVFHRSLEP